MASLTKISRLITPVSRSIRRCIAPCCVAIVTLLLPVRALPWTDATCCLPPYYCSYTLCNNCSQNASTRSITTEDVVWQGGLPPVRSCLPSRSAVVIRVHHDLNHWRP